MGRADPAAMNKTASLFPAPDRPALSVVEDRIIISNLELTDAGLAGFVAGIPEPERPGLAANALRVGLQALANAGTTANVDLVRAEFGRMVEQMAATQTRAAETLEATLRATFADGDGRLPRTLEDFLGDSGKLQRLTGALFDPNRRDSAIGQFNETLGKYFDGDGSRLAQLLDPTREASPLYQFRNEVTGEFRSLGSGSRPSRQRAGPGPTNGLAARPRASSSRTRWRPAWRSWLAVSATTSSGPGPRPATRSSKKGDFVLTIDPSRTNGRELRVVIEAKDRSLSRRVLAEELAAARGNRGAAIGLAVFTHEHAPTGVSPFALVGSDVYAVYDPEADGGVGLKPLSGSPASWPSSPCATPAARWTWPPSQRPCRTSSSRSRTSGR